MKQRMHQGLIRKVTQAQQASDNTFLFVRLTFVRRASLEAHQRKIFTLGSTFKVQIRFHHLDIPTDVPVTKKSRTCTAR